MPKDAKGHGSNARPLRGHPFHAKTNDQLRYIMKDASEAARATRGMSAYNPNSGRREDSEGKYLDQVNDAASVLGYRDRGGTSDHPDDVAARALSSGPKSAPAATHDSMASLSASIERGHAMRSAGDGGHVSGYNEHGSRHGYNPESVNNAIKNNRTGKIGGKEASAIHRLLKGR